MISPEDYYGGALDLGTMSADYAIPALSKVRVVRVGDNSGGHEITLPDGSDPRFQEDLKVGGPVLYVINDDASNTVDVAGVTVSDAAIVVSDESGFHVFPVTTL